MPKGNTATKKRGQSDDYEAATKPGKIKKGRLVDGDVVFEDEVDEKEDEEDDDLEEDDEDDDLEVEDLEDDADEDDDEDEDDEPVITVKKKGKAAPVADKSKKDDKKPKKSKAKDDDDEPKLKPSQRAALPAHQRKVAEEKITKKSVIVTVKDLEEEYGFDGKKIRRVIRAMGYKAPDTTGPADAFGAKKKYEWDSKSPHLKAIKAALDEEAEG